MIGLAALCASFSGFTALCLAMERHHRDVLGGKPTARRRMLLKAAGAAGVIVALALLASARAWIGLVEWVGVLAAGATLVAVVLAYRPKAAPLAGIIAATAVLPVAIAGFLAS